MQLRLSFASLQLFVFLLARSLFLLNSDMYAHATLLGDNEGKMDSVDGMKGDHLGQPQSTRCRIPIENEKTIWPKFWQLKTYGKKWYGCSSYSMYISCARARLIQFSCLPDTRATWSQADKIVCLELLACAWQILRTANKHDLGMCINCLWVRWLKTSTPTGKLNLSNRVCKRKKLYWADQEVMFDNYTFSFE